MRRSTPFALLALITAVVLPGCSGPGEGAPDATGSSVNAIGDPNDTASPIDTSPPTPPVEPPPPTDVAAESPTRSPLDVGTAVLAACLNGNWGAPMSREFTPLGLSERTRGVVRGGEGLLQLTFGRDRSFTFTYAEVRLSLVAGHADVNGPVKGTWSLTDATLTTVPVTNTVEVTYGLGPASVGAPAALTGFVKEFPPAQVIVSCTDDELQMQLPAAGGGGIVRFDRA